MLSQIKKVLKKTPLYPAILARRTKQWTEQDQAARSFYGQFLSPGDLVFDVGANLGARTKVFLALGCKVVAVEPQQFCAATLKHAFGNQITVVQCALSDQVGEASLQVGEDTVFATVSTEWVEAVKQSGRFGGNPWTGTVTVPTLTADTLVRKHGTPKFMKIDVEGHELSVLQGLSLPIPILSMEFTAETLSTAEKCLERLCSLAEYEFNYSSAESMTFAEEQWQSKDLIMTVLRNSAQSDSDLWGDIYARTSTRGAD